MAEELRSNTLAIFSDEDRKLIDAAAEAMRRQVQHHRRSYDEWIVIGLGRQRVKAKADELKLTRDQRKQLYAQKGGAATIVATDSQLSKLADIMPRLPEV